MARELFNVFVAEGVSHDLMLDDLFDIPMERRPPLASKLATYRKGAILHALVSLSQSDAKTLAILSEYEALLAGVALKEAAGAMVELDALRRDPDLPLTWAQNWLATCGIEENNPVVLGRVCLHWLDVSARGIETVDEVRLL